MAKNYGNLASTAATASPVGPSDLTATLSSFSGYPAAPFWGEFEKGTVSAEIVLVTNVAGNVITITRGQGGTSATSHGAGVAFEHVVPAVHFNDTEAHQDATSAHGVTGNIVGTSGSQTIQDKTYRGAHRSLHSDALPAGVTASYESVADNANTRDGFVHRNTAGDVDRRGFLLQQSGVDRVQAFNDGTVDLTPGASSRPGLRSRGTSQLDGNVTAGGTVTVTGAANLNGGVNVTGTAALAATTATTVSASSTIHAGGTIDTDANLVVDINATVGGTLGVTGTSTLGTVNAGAVSGSSVAATGAVTAHGGRTIACVANLAGIGSPVLDQAGWNTTSRDLYRHDGTVWVPASQVAGRIVSAAGVIHSGVTTTEQTIDRLAIENVRIKGGTVYIFNVTLSAQLSVANDSFTVRIREGTPGSGTVLAQWQWITLVSSFTHSESFIAPWKAPADDADGDFFVSIVRAAGTGAASINGDRKTAFWIDDRGADSVVWQEVS